MPHSVIDQPEIGQFRVHLAEEHYAVVKYQLKNDVYTITSTKVPEALQGQGYGKVMMEVVLTEIEQRGAKVEPVCSYVVHYLNRQAQWAHMKVDA